MFYYFILGRSLLASLIKHLDSVAPCRDVERMVVNEEDFDAKDVDRIARLGEAKDEEKNGSLNVVIISALVSTNILAIVLASFLIFKLLEKKKFYLSHDNTVII
jgi:hypothetical protein